MDRLLQRTRRIGFAGQIQVLALRCVCGIEHQLWHTFRPRRQTRMHGIVVRKRPVYRGEESIDFQRQRYGIVRAQVELGGLGVHALLQPNVDLGRGQRSALTSVVNHLVRHAWLILRPCQFLNKCARH